MNARPILFSAPMVRAILDGRKTQTRRAVKPAELQRSDDIEPYDGRPGEWVCWRGGEHHSTIICPYGIPGDRLWVREKWRIGAWDENTGRVALDYVDEPRREWLEIPDDDDGELFNTIWQQSTDDAMAVGARVDYDGNYRWKPGESPCRWRPSIHMPRWASRITLEITDVRVQRLQEISEDDCIAEGIDRVKSGPFGFRDYEWLDAQTGIEAWKSYASLWDSINGKRAPWSSNPWVWCITFKRLP